MKVFGKRPSAEKLGVGAGIALTVSNMVGTGVFTGLGYQLYDNSSIWSVCLLWILGGFTAFCGAVAYYRLISIYPGSGGETHFVAQMYGRWLGLLVALLSVVFGFMAPIALSAIAFASYLQTLIPWDLKILACLAIVLVSMVHLLRLTVRGAFQTGLAVVKMGMIMLFIVAGLMYDNGAAKLDWAIQREEVDAIFTAPFLGALMFVHYAYSGWNTSVYVFSELENKRTVYVSLFFSVVWITVLYVLLNIVFMRSVDIDLLRGVTEVGQVVGDAIFGPIYGGILVSIIGLLLIGNVSAMVWAGAQVSLKYKELLPIGGSSGGKNSLHVLIIAVGSILFVLKYDFEKLLLITSCILSLVSVAVVLGLFWTPIRLRKPHDLTFGTKICVIFYAIMMLSSSIYVLLIF
ncbi:APC family permease [Sphingobacterium yanglingense]|uniref:Amino acid/polyamine/organocation transporter (APC superfamily) n=1 Tax=Sphingobacterium yanglingense TaxID=1437280 RepID=A0A4R6WR47_9SPHI|nr:amino acid permease [Sphingobacterium yanglingense]TDQ79106.1 amino acid/polyamine/organocation transporter (APC superfamily) [Sphingobacterium yanglingense]